MSSSPRAPAHYFRLDSIKDSWSEGLLVLMYHSVGAPPLLHGLRGLYVTPRHLARQLGEVRSIAGLTTLGEWNRGRPSARQVAVTFDDAYHNLLVNGLSVLQETGVRALTYVVANLIGKSNEWDRATGARREALMDRAQLDEWIRSGHEIGSHGLTHRDLTVLSTEEARREIVESKKRLEDGFGQPIRHFCYPYGSWNETLRSMVQEAGYETAASTVPGFNTSAGDAFVLRRFLARHSRPWLAALTRW